MTHWPRFTDTHSIDQSGNLRRSAEIKERKVKYAISLSIEVDISPREDQPNDIELGNAIIDFVVNQCRLNPATVGEHVEIFDESEEEDE